MAPMYEFYVTVHARAHDVAAGETVTLRGRSWPALRLPPCALATTFAITFEDAVQSLAKLERMYVEGDGSFVWVSSAHDRSWQVDGVLYDRDGRLLFVDLKGSCPAADFDRLLATFGWPATAVMFQLTREAVFLDEATFRAWASVDQSAS